MKIESQIYWRFTWSIGKPIFIPLPTFPILLVFFGWNTRTFLTKQKNLQIAKNICWWRNFYKRDLLFEFSLLWSAIKSRLVNYERLFYLTPIPLRLISDSSSLKLSSFYGLVGILNTLNWTTSLLKLFFYYLRFSVHTNLLVYALPLP